MSSPHWLAGIGNDLFEASSNQNGSIGQHSVTSGADKLADLDDCQSPSWIQRQLDKTERL